MTRKKKVLVWSSASLGLGLVFWFFRSALLGFADKVITWVFPWNVIALGISLLGFFMRRITKKVFKKTVVNNPQSTSSRSVWTGMPRWVVFGGLLALTLVIGAALFFATSTKGVLEPNTNIQNQVQVAKTNTHVAEEPSTAGRGFVFLLLFAMLTAVTWMAWREKRTCTWTERLSQPVFIAIIGVIVLNALSNLFIYPTWRWFWDHQTLFWGVNMALVLFVHFTTKKESYAKFVAGGIAFLILMGFATEIAGNKKINTTTASLNKASGTSSPSFTNIPVDVAKQVVCECESNCQQFESDGKTPFKNRGIPDKGVPPSSAFGKYQFLEVHRKIALGLNPSLDLNTEEGQEKYFEYLYGKEGFKPWDHDNQYGGGSACWGPKLVARGYGVGESKQIIAQTRVVIAPVNEWSEVINLPTNGEDGGKTSLSGLGKKYTVQWNGEIEEELPRAEGTEPKNPSRPFSLRVKSREAEPIQVTVRFF